MMKKGQAVLELAVLGSLIIMAFSVLLMYGQRFEDQQAVKMEAFRLALQKAWQRNSSVSYTLKRDSRAFNLLAGFNQPSTLSASAQVMWQKGAPGEQGSKDQASFSYYQINDLIVGNATYGLPRETKTSVNLDGSKREVKVPLSVWKEETKRKEEIKTSIGKVESGSGIENTKTRDLKDTITTQLYYRFDNAVDEYPWDNNTPLPEYVDKGSSESFSQGAYLRDDINRIDYSKDTVGTTVHEERKWNTPH